MTRKIILLVVVALTSWGVSAYTQTHRRTSTTFIFKPKLANNAPLRRVSFWIFAATTAATLSGGTMIANAAPPTSPLLDAKKFEHSYSDPLHMECIRRITVDTSSSGTILAHFDGTDVGEKGSAILRGCSKTEVEQYGLRSWSLDGFVSGDSISVGDGVHEGRWDTNGIRWNDGNKWTVISKNEGAVVAYAWFLISAYAGVKGIADKFKEADEAK